MNLAIASIPESNRIKLGQINTILPEKDLRNYYSEMEPIMLKYFGPPFSDLTLDLDISLDKNHDFGIFPEAIKLISFRAR